jgi:ornithine--oxo-acid transaminase
VSKLTSQDHINLTLQYAAHNYLPIKIVITEGKGVWVKDVEGNKYLDMLSGYSALNFGHANPRINKVAKDQIDKLALTSRAFLNDQFSLLCKELAELCKMDKVLMMNSGAEAVETAIKLSRKWGYEVKGIEKDKAEIIAFSGNFHGRTTTIVSFSDSESSYKNFGPFMPGFKVVEYGEIDALEKSITKNTAAILIEPIQGEGGVIIPPPGYLKKVKELCIQNNILFLADEVQTAFYRTGSLFCCEADGVDPDIYILGKSLGGGIMPVSAIVAKDKVMNVFTHGTHGSTFGGNPLACAIAREVIAILKEPEIGENVKKTGAYFEKALRSLGANRIEEIRSRGMMFGVDINPSHGMAKEFCLELAKLGVLTKDTRDQTIRFAPPLIITESEIDWALERIAKVL